MRHLSFPAAAIAACLLAVLLAACSADEPAAEPTSGPPPTNATATPTPAASPTSEAVAGDPVEVVVDAVEARQLSNIRLGGGEEPHPAEGIVEEAIEQARRSLERYLNAQFVEPATRYGPEPAADLLGEGVTDGLDADDRRGLGDIDLGAVASPVSAVPAQAVALTDGESVLSVVLTYDATFALEDGAGDERRLRQRGRVLFPAGQDGDWRAEMAELTLELPEEPAP